MQTWLPSQLSEGTYSFDAIMDIDDDEDSQAQQLVDKLHALKCVAM